MKKSALKQKKLTDQEFIEIIKQSVGTNVINHIIQKDAIGFTITRYFNGDDDTTMKTVLRLHIELMPTEIARAEMQSAKFHYLH